MNDLVPSDNGNPFGDEQAKAIQELAKFGGTSVEALTPLVGWLGRVIGTVPEDIVGILLGAPLRYLRIKQYAWYQERVEAIHQQRGTKAIEALSPTLALPLLEGAEYETQGVLRELWARLIANATDPERANSVQRRLVEVLRKMDPLDALVFQKRMEQPDANWQPNFRDMCVQTLKCPTDEVEVSIDHLVDIGCLRIGSIGDKANPLATPLGRTLFRAVSE